MELGCRNIGAESNKTAGADGEGRSGRGCPDLEREAAVVADGERHAARADVPNVSRATRRGVALEPDSWGLGGVDVQALGGRGGAEPNATDSTDHQRVRRRAAKDREDPSRRDCAAASRDQFESVRIRRKAQVPTSAGNGASQAAPSP